MKIYFIFITTVLIYHCSCNLDIKWNKFKTDFERSYSESEDKLRKDIFANTLELINQHQERFRNGLETYEMDVNQFADMTNEEFESNMANDYNMEMENDLFESQTPVLRNRSQDNLPASVNWVEYGFKQRIQQQGRCGSCAPFAAVAGIEGQYYIKYGRLIKLSEQEILDCSKSYGNRGCQGGAQRLISNYVLENGVGDASTNPYTGGDDRCRKNSPRIYIKSYYQIPTGDEEELKRAVATVGPIPAACYSNTSSFKYYKGGILYDPACLNNRITHAVTVVGYGTTRNGTDYWIIRNAWGTRWGDQGYMYLARNRNNQCAIARRAVYPILN